MELKARASASCLDYGEPIPIRKSYSGFRLIRSIHSIRVSPSAETLEVEARGRNMKTSSTLLACVVAVLIAATTPAVAAQGHVDAQGPTEQLGTVHLANSCAPATAPQFDRGVALLHSFEFGSAIRTFNEVLAADSTCAMAYWGIALSHWLNPMLAQTRGPAQLKPGREAAEAATRLAANATDRERGYITAVSRLYDDYEHVDQRTRLVAYETAMRDLVTAQPQDTEATIFYALALAAAAPPTDKTYANQLEAAAILEPLFAKQPNHPGLAHYLIHSYDYPPLAAKAGDAARRYAAIAPSSSHAL